MDTWTNWWIFGISLLKEDSRSTRSLLWKRSCWRTMSLNTEFLYFRFKSKIFLVTQCRQLNECSWYGDKKIQANLWMGWIGRTHRRCCSAGSQIENFRKFSPSIKRWTSSEHQKAKRSVSCSLPHSFWLTSIQRCKKRLACLAWWC